MHAGIMLAKYPLKKIVVFIQAILFKNGRKLMAISQAWVGLPIRITTS